MASRWQKRSEAEKLEILEKQKQVVEKKEEKENPHDGKFAAKIYEGGNLPIFCPKCMKWSYSEKYTMGMRSSPAFMGGFKFLALEGKCIHCGDIIHRAVPNPTSEEGMLLFPLAANNLQRNGRLAVAHETERRAM